jgi:hypothetical protein
MGRAIGLPRRDTGAAESKVGRSRIADRPAAGRWAEFHEREASGDRNDFGQLYHGRDTKLFSLVLFGGDHESSISHDVGTDRPRSDISRCSIAGVGFLANRFDPLFGTLGQAETI